MTGAKVVDEIERDRAIKRLECARLHPGSIKSVGHPCAHWKANVPESLFRRQRNAVYTRYERNQNVDLTRSGGTIHSQRIMHAMAITLSDLSVHFSNKKSGNDEPKAVGRRPQRERTA